MAAVPHSAHGETESQRNVAFQCLLRQSAGLDKGFVLAAYWAFGSLVLGPQSAHLDDGQMGQSSPVLPHGALVDLRSP